MFNSFIPLVKDYSPRRIADLNTQIRVEFSVDLDESTISNSIVLLDANGNTLPLTIQYTPQVITATLSSFLDPDAIYRVKILANRIISVHGLAMAQDHNFSFKTRPSFIEAPEIQYPIQETVLTENSIDFSWTIVDNAAKYELQISKSPTMSPLVWPIGGGENFSIANSLIPDYEFENTHYFCRVRAIDSNDVISAWSETISFGVSDEEEVPIIVQEETEMVSSYPEDGFINASTFREAIFVTLIGIEGLQEEDIETTVIGLDVLDREFEDSHGEVGHTVEIINNDDGSVTIKMTLNELEA